LSENKPKKAPRKKDVYPKRKRKRRPRRMLYWSIGMEGYVELTRS
jgi:hypothetical protein